MRTLTIFMMLIVLSLSATAAHAELWSFSDNVTHWGDWGTKKENGKDIIGIPDFTDGRAIVNTRGGTNTLQSVTFDFKAESYGHLYPKLTSGDLFVNTNNDNAWDFVVRLNDDKTASVFHFNVDYNAAASNYKMGYADGNFRDNHPAWAADVSGLTLFGTGTWSGMPEYPGPGKTGQITISGLGLDFQTLALGYTVSCSNDVVYTDAFSKTPIPGAVWLLGSGLLGLFGLRRRS